MHNIETATAGDIPQLVGLLHALFTQEADFHPDPARQARGLAQIIEQPDHGRIFVLREHGEILGMVNVLFSISTALGGPVAWIEDMVVKPGHRGNGIGSALLRHAIDFARDTGLLRLTLLTDTVNSEAQRFYERHGFERSPMLPMRRVF